MTQIAKKKIMLVIISIFSIHSVVCSNSSSSLSLQAICSCSSAGAMWWMRSQPHSTHLLPFVSGSNPWHLRHPSHAASPIRGRPCGACGNKTLVLSCCCSKKHLGCLGCSSHTAASSSVSATVWTLLSSAYAFATSASHACLAACLRAVCSSSSAVVGQSPSSSLLSWSHSSSRAKVPPLGVSAAAFPCSPAMPRTSRGGTWSFLREFTCAQYGAGGAAMVRRRPSTRFVAGAPRRLGVWVFLWSGGFLEIWPEFFHRGGYLISFVQFRFN